MESVASGSGMTAFEKRKRDNSPSEELFTSKRQQTWYYVLGPESDHDSDGTESVYSIQDKSTEYVRDTSDTSTKSSWSWNRDMVQYEVVSFSEGETTHPFPSNCDSSSYPEDILKTRIIKVDTNWDKLSDKSLDCSSDELDLEPFPPKFLRCVKCKVENSNTLFRFCDKCFKVRKNFFPPRPRGKKLRKPRRLHNKDINSPLQQETSGIGSSVSEKGPTSQENESLCATELTQVKRQLKNSDSVNESSDLCETCFLYPKDGGYVHTNIVHVYNCYKCCVKILKQRGTCPICNVKVRQILRIVRY